MTTTLTANPNVTNWIFYSCNDDGVLGAARALENAGYTRRPGHGHRHRRQPRLRRFRLRQAVGVPRHDVAELGQSRRAGGQAAARLDQGRHGAAGAVLHRSRNTSPPRTSTRTTRPSSALEAAAMRRDGAGSCRSRRRLHEIGPSGAGLDADRILRARACLEALRRRAGARRRVARRSGRANCWRWSARTAPASRR